jgi:hypothetical protein
MADSETMVTCREEVVNKAKVVAGSATVNKNALETWNNAVEMFWRSVESW